MNKKYFGFIAAFLGLAANVVSAINAPFTGYTLDEVDRLHTLLLSKSQNGGAVLLMPKPLHRNEKYLWLIAHGSHVSHGSHSSHVSHASGTSHRSGSSCSVYNPIPPIISASMIPGFKDTKLVVQKNFPLVLYLPSSTLEYSSIEYRVSDKPHNGTLSINIDGQIIYTPNPGFVSMDSFSIIATDGITLTEPVLFAINVKAQ